MIGHIIHFNQMDVEVCQETNGKWKAFDGDGSFPLNVVGHGSTMMEAIVDLREQLEEG